MTDKKHGVFYGWWIVVASFFIAICMGGVIFYGFTAFFEPIMDELGWSYTQVSLATSLRGLQMGLLAPLMGMFVDRWDPTGGHSRRRSHLWLWLQWAAGTNNSQAHLCV